MNRFKAFAIHFAISLVIFFILLFFILAQWYPEPLFSNDGGWRVIRIIIGVDLILGPVLTLMVFKVGKPGLKFDLAMIAIVQALALSWGVWVTYNERPVAYVYTLDYFTPVPAYQLAEQGITSKELKKYGDSSPVYIYSDIPKEKVSQSIVKSMKAGKPLYLLTEYYKNMSSEQSKILKDGSMNLEKYVKDKPKLKQLYKNALLSTVQTNVSYLALHSREKWNTVIFDLDKMKIIGSIDIEPSAYTYAQPVKRKKQKEASKKIK